MNSNCPQTRPHACDIADLWLYIGTGSSMIEAVLRGLQKLHDELPESELKHKLSGNISYLKEGYDKIEDGFHIILDMRK